MRKNTDVYIREASLKQELKALLRYYRVSSGNSVQPIGTVFKGQDVRVGRYATPTDTTLQMLRLDQISSDHTVRDICLHTHSAQNIRDPGTCIWNGYHIFLISQHGNFMLTNFMYFRTLMF